MAKVILIKGSTNSHKTGSAREFALTHLTGFTYIGHSPTKPVGVPSGIPPTGDFVAVGTCIKSGVVHQVGIASAGDTGSLIDLNLTYFSSLPDLGHVDKRSNPEPCGGEVEETHEGQDGLVVAGRDTAHL
ncbi:hypothetical protein, partial [Asaia spathodeae]|uniref:hypothetical protein n=1 Tax=Asaia spathodeae TaxID=657016 RepID=UPI002FC3DFD7